MTTTKVGLTCWCGNEPEWYIKNGELWYGCTHHPHKLLGTTRIGQGDMTVGRTHNFKTVEEAFEYFAPTKIDPTYLIDNWNWRVRIHLDRNRGPHCPNCGTKCKGEWYYCPCCGTDLTKEEESDQD